MMKCQYCEKKGANKYGLYRECDDCHTKIVKGFEDAKKKPSKTFFLDLTTGRDVRIK